MKKWLKRTAVGIGLVVCIVIALLAYWMCRPNTAWLAPSLEIESWIAVSDGQHNSNTDLIHWNGQFYLIHASSPWHFGSEKCHLVLHRSSDAQTWEQVATFNVPGQDIRDPKFAAIGDRLFIYVLKNVDWNPEPYTTALTTSADGKTWSPLEDVEPKGWLFWRPKTRDGKTWYVPAYWWEHGKSILLKSSDGRKWERLSQIYEGDRNDETAIAFMPDGRMLCTARLEVSDSIFGHKDGCTLIAVAKPPYAEWKRTKSRVTRLDGPALFTYEGAVYAVGRHNPDRPKPGRWIGSVLGRKRTSLYEVRPDGLVWLSDLPSSGDTSYAGVVIRDADAYICYYTNDITTDYPWLLGMVAASDIRMAKIHLPRLRELANASQ
jgi:hypothetical protein